MLTKISWPLPVGGLMRHDSYVLSAQFSADGRRMVTASLDGTARLWEAATGKPIGEPMKHSGWVMSAQFSPDGRRVMTTLLTPYPSRSPFDTTTWKNTAWLWDVPTISSKDTAEELLLLADLAEATGGVALQASGEAGMLNVLTPEQARATRDKIAAKFAMPFSDLTPLQRFLKWSVSDPRARTISPFSELAVPEWVENRITEGTVDGLRAAIQVDPANARLAANFGRRLTDYAIAKETAPDEARRAQGEADFQTRRALKLAPDNEDVKKMRAEVVKLLQLPE